MKAAMRKISIFVMPLFYIAAGLNHFWHPITYLKIMPNWIAYKEFLVLLSGIIEVLLGILLIFKQSRVIASRLIIVLLVLIFPANIQMMVDYKSSHNPYFWITILRLPLQVVLIGWAYKYPKFFGNEDEIVT